MKRSLDFARPQPPVRLRPRLAGTLLLVAGAGLATFLTAWFAELHQRTQATEARIERLREAGPLRAPQERRVPEQLLGEVQRVNGAIARLTVPWDGLFGALERAKHERIALLSLQPNLASGEVRIAGEADDFGALRAFLERLKNAQAFGDVQLVTHEIAQRGAAATIRFELSARWRARML